MTISSHHTKPDRAEGRNRLSFLVVVVGLMPVVVLAVTTYLAYESLKFDRFVWEAEAGSNADVSSFDLEYRVLSSDEEVVWVNENVRPVKRKGRADTWRGVIVDITKRVKAEEALRQSQKLESLGLVTSGIAHDFNNLLTVIIGNTELVGKLTPKESAAHQFLDMINTTSQRLAELTNQMLVYTGQGNFIISKVDLNDVIAETGNLISSKDTIPLATHASRTSTDFATPRRFANSVRRLSSTGQSFQVNTLIRKG